METKEQIRKKIKKKRELLPDHIRKQESEALSRQLLRWDVFQNTEQIYGYYPLEKEASLIPLFDDCLKKGKKLALPKITGLEMEFYEVHSLEELKEGYFHVMEPMGEKPVQWSEALVLAPGIVFDRTGIRHGYGKGFYDNYLEKHSRNRTVGILLQCQLYEGMLPREAKDRPMDYLACPNEIICCRRDGGANGAN